MRRLYALFMILTLIAPVMAQTPAERIKNYMEEWDIFTRDVAKNIDWLIDNGYKVQSEVASWKEIEGILQKAREAIAAKKFDEAKSLLQQADEKYGVFQAKIDEIVRSQDLEGIFEDLEKWITDVDNWLNDLEKGGYNLATVSPEWEKIRGQYREAENQFSAGEDEKAWATMDRANKEYARWEAKLEKELNAQDKEWQEWCDSLVGWKDDLAEWIENERGPAQKAKEAGYSDASEHLRLIEVEFDPLLQTAGNALNEGDCTWASENLQELESSREYFIELGNEWWNNIQEQINSWEPWMEEKKKQLEDLKSAAKEKGIEADFSRADEIYDYIRQGLDNVHALLEDPELVGWGVDDQFADLNTVWEELENLLWDLTVEIKGVPCTSDADCGEGYSCRDGYCVVLETVSEANAEGGAT